MPDEISISINGASMRVTRGTTVSAALLNAGVPCRTSTTGEPRTALCGMGICFECRATVDGITQQRTCQIVCHPGMMVETQ